MGAPQADPIGVVSVGADAMRSPIPESLWRPVCDRPLDREVYGHLGDWLFGQGRWAAAIVAYLRRFDPGGKSLMAYRRFSQTVPQDEADRELGIDFLRAGEAVTAIACGRRAVMLQPNQPKNWVLLGDAWRILGDECEGSELGDLAERDRQVVTAYLEALYRDPSLREAYMGLSFWGRKRDREDALQCGRKWLSPSLLREFAPEATWQERPIAAAIAAGTVTMKPLRPADPTYELAASRSPFGDAPYHTFETTPWPRPSEQAIAVPDARLWCDHYTHALFDRDGYLLRGDLDLGGTELIAASPHLPPADRLPGRSAVLAMAGCSMYCHWILNMLPRLGLLEQAGESIENLDWILVNGDELSFQHHSLEMLGIPKSKIVPVNPHWRHLRLETAIVPSRIERLRPWVVDFLRDRFWPHAQPCAEVRSKRLYISRRQADYRRLIDEDDLIVKLYQRGFQGVCLETFPLTQQIAMMAQAEVIVAPHGAGLTNIAFCRPGTIVLEICSPVYAPHYFWELAACAQVRHYHLIGRDLDEHPDPEAVKKERYVDPAAEGIWIDPDRVVAALDALGIT
ncbi:MAG: glycosyltransferase family 61 protein [Cyanobacteria bacterium]|nr:glycosyltransferase family 61 protein [Cyanobacteriota bacterium]